MENQIVKVARYRTTEYYVNYPTNNGGIKTYTWSGSKGKKVDIKPIPMEVIDYLTVNSRCFKEGELKIIEDTPVAKEVVETIPDKEEYEANSHSKDEIEKLLSGNFNKMKSELGKITNKDEKKFVVETAKEIKLDSNSKLKFIAEWYGVKQDILFED